MAPAAQDDSTLRIPWTDGSTVEVRPARPSDRSAVRDFHAALPEQHSRLRSDSGREETTQQAADRVCASEPGCYGVLALRRGRIVGTADFAVGHDPTAARIALAVAEEFSGHDLEAFLTEQLARVARGEGVTAFLTRTTDDALVPDVCARLGLPAECHREPGGVRWRVRLDTAERYRTTADVRGGPKDASGLESLLLPRSVVVVGAGRSPGSTGRAVLRNLRRSGFPGKLYAVNPEAHAIERTPCYPSVAALPHVPDLAVLTGPAHAAAEAARQCGEAGVRGMAVLTSGLEQAQEDELFAQCRRHGMRVLGPGSLGLANTRRGVDLDAGVARLPPPGHVGVAVQSGGIGLALLEGLTRLGMGVSSFLSLGGTRDVSGSDVLQWWGEDGHTDLALLHLDVFGDPREFSRTARRVARHIPVLTVDAGRSVPGRRAAATHTAAAAASAVTRQELFAQAGIVATPSLGDLLGTAALVHSQPPPTGNAVAVVSNTSGTCVLAADACSEAGLDLPQPPQQLSDLLRELLPAGATASNPVDTTTAVGEVELAACVDLLAGWAEIDAVVVLLVPTETAAAGGNDPVQALIAPSGPSRTDTTVVAVLPDQAERIRLLERPSGPAVPSYADPQDAARAVSHAARRARWSARPPDDPPPRFPVDTAAALARVKAFLFRHPGGGWLDRPACRDLLDDYGIPRAREEWATDEETAVRQAADLAPSGMRVALKGESPGLLHKRRRGAVHLDLQGAGQVRAAYRDTARRLGTHMEGAVVQRMVPAGVDLLAGVVQDVVFGPLVLFGLGGTASDVLAVGAARLAPLTAADARALLRSPRCAPLLSGEDGAEPLDDAALVDVLLRLSQLVGDVPELVEAELNPLVTRPDGVAAVDFRIRLAPLRSRTART